MNRLVIALARSRAHWIVGRHTVVLSYTGPKSGRLVELPVEAVRDGQRWLVAVGAAERKTWWKAFRAGPHLALLRTGRRARSVIGRVLRGPARETALTAYLRGRRRGTLDPDTPVVEFRPTSPDA